MKPAPLVRGLAATLVLFTVAAAAVAVRSTSAAARRRPVASGPSKGDPALGKAIFTKNCVVCHKADGTGGVKLTGNPTPELEGRQDLGRSSARQGRLLPRLHHQRQGQVGHGGVGQERTGQAGRTSRT